MKRYWSNLPLYIRNEWKSNFVGHACMRVWVNELMRSIPKVMPNWYFFERNHWAVVAVEWPNTTPNKQWKVYSLAILDRSSIDQIDVYLDWIIQKRALPYKTETSIKSTAGLFCGLKQFSPLHVATVLINNTGLFHTITVNRCMTKDRALYPLTTLAFLSTLTSYVS